MDVLPLDAREGRRFVEIVLGALTPDPSDRIPDRERLRQHVVRPRRQARPRDTIERYDDRSRLQSSGARAWRSSISETPPDRPIEAQIPRSIRQPRSGGRGGHQRGPRVGRVNTTRRGLPTTNQRGEVSGRRHIAARTSRSARRPPLAARSSVHRA